MTTLHIQWREIEQVLQKALIWTVYISRLIYVFFSDKNVYHIGARDVVEFVLP